MRARRRHFVKRRIRRLLGKRNLVVLVALLLVATVALRSWGGTANGYPVVSVVDGDTVKVRVGGRVETVRLIGIDAPEAATSGRPAQCFGPESTAKAKELLAGKVARLEFDESQGRRDRYDRLLAYVWVNDVLVNDWMIRQGYAREFTYRLPYRYQAAFQAAEQEARAAGRGLWAANTCGGRQ